MRAASFILSAGHIDEPPIGQPGNQVTVREHRPGGRFGRLDPMVADPARLDFKASRTERAG